MISPATTGPPRPWISANEPGDRCGSSVYRSVHTSGTFFGRRRRHRPRFLSERIDAMRRCPCSPGLFRLVLLFAALASSLQAATLKPRLATDHELWLQGVEHLLSPEEKEGFLALTEPEQRDLFQRHFWQSRSFTQADEPPTVKLASDATPEAPYLRPLRRWRESFEAARARFRDLSRDRARAYLLAGRPADTLDIVGCEDVIRPLEVWHYEPWHLLHQSGRETEEGLLLVFYRQGSEERGRYLQWDPASGVAPLMYAFTPSAEWTVERLITFAEEKDCLRWHRGKEDLFAAALRRASSVERLEELLRPTSGHGDWLRVFETALAAGEKLPAQDLEIEALGRYAQKTVLRGRVRVPIAHVARGRGTLLFDRLVLTGDVWRGSRLADSFAVIHLVAGAPTGPTIPLDFFRRLRPGSYRLELRLEDGLGLPLLRLSRPLEVAPMESEATTPAGLGKDLPGLTRSEVGLLTTLPSLALLPPPASAPLAGRVEIEASTTGGPIDRVDFQLEGKPAGSDDEPPYAALLDLGPTPRRQRLVATAFDPAGRPLATAETLLNAASERFALRLLEPKPGQPGGQIRAEVDVPGGHRLVGLDLYLDAGHIATLTEPPFVHPLPPGWRSATFVRAEARLDDGRRQEAMVLLPSLPSEEVDVQLVELYASVQDAKGRPLLDLTSEDFRIFENETEQALQRFEKVRRLPIRVALLMDVSSSMRGRVHVAAESARRFFDTVITEQDRASLLTFAHDIRLLVPWSADRKLLRHGASGLRAHGTTRLHDALLYAGSSFAGLGAKRALVLLSDGEDVDSDFDFASVLEFFLRARLAVYPILLDVTAPETREQLRHLADVSGGSLHEVSGVGELDRVYRSIEEDLRSQYLLVYEPPPRSASDSFRKVRVQVARPGAKARTLSGYYP